MRILTKFVGVPFVFITALAPAAAIAQNSAVSAAVRQSSRQETP